MKIEGIEVEQALESVRTALREDPGLSTSLRTALEMLLVLVAVLLNRVTLGSRNSSTPPSQDPHRQKKSRQGTNGRARGGQPGHRGTTLMPVEEPDEVEVLAVNRALLPPGRSYREAGFERRQVIDLDISRFVGADPGGRARRALRRALPRRRDATGAVRTRGQGPCGLSIAVPTAAL